MSWDGWRAIHFGDIALKSNAFSFWVTFVSRVAAEPGAGGLMTGRIFGEGWTICSTPVRAQSPDCKSLGGKVIKPGKGGSRWIANEAVDAGGVRRALQRESNQIKVNQTKSRLEMPGVVTDCSTERMPGWKMTEMAGVSAVREVGNGSNARAFRRSPVGRSPEFA